MRPSTSRSSSCAERGSSARFRSRTPCCGGLRTAPATSSRRCRSRRPRRRPFATRIPTGSPRRGGAISAQRRHVRSCAPRTSRRRRSCGSSAARSTGVADDDDPGRMARRAGRRGGAGRGAHLAPEPRVAARGALRRRPGWGARARPVRRTRREGVDARRRGRRRRGERGAGARARREPAHGSARDACRSSAPTARELPTELAGFDRALVDAPCSGLGVLAARPDLRWRVAAAAGPAARAAARRCRPRAPRGHGHVLRLHRQRRRGGGRRRRERPRRSTRRSPRPGRGSATRADRSSCRRCRTSTARRASSSLASARTSACN